MYLALYRKFRPDNFFDVVGQEHIIKTLKNQIINDQIGHAYLFCGSRGTGKTSVAKVFAKAVNCLSPRDGSPCGECEVCKKLKETNNIDIIEIDAASNNRVDEVRDIRDKVKYPPLYGKYKVYIIDEVHMLTDSAFNALLKTLEEPPAHTIFILATTEPQKLPATILSRVLRFDFKLVGLDDLIKHIKNIFEKSGIKAEDEAIVQIAKAGNGSVRDSLSIADMCASFANNNIKYSDVLEVLGTSNQEVLCQLAQAVLEGDISEFVVKLDAEIKSGKNVVNLLEDITKEFRDILVIKTAGINKDVIDLPVAVQEKLKALGDKFELSRINDALIKFSDIEYDLKYSNNPQLLLEVTAMKFLKTKQDINQVKNESSLNIIKNVDLTEKKEVAQNLDNTSITTPHKVWGQVLAKLHDENVILHSALADVSNVKIENDRFIVGIENSSILDIIKKTENYTNLVACFKKLGYNYNIEITKVEAEKKIDKTKILSEKLGISVQIKNKRN